MPAVALSLAWADEPEKFMPPDPLHDIYRDDAERCSFLTAGGEPLTLVKEPVMRWSTDDDWSGDIFVWTHEKRPEVIGCIMSGPNGALRRVVHEFHLLGETPIAPAVVQNGRRWKAAEGLKRTRLVDAPPPAASASARLVQMRQIARSFTVTMENDGRPWELRLLPQPLLRYGHEDSEVADGALFCYVWPKGTDPEFILLVECRGDNGESAWHFAPARFTTRELWLKRNDREEWHAEAFSTGTLPPMLYTVGDARAIPKPRVPADDGEP